MSTMVKKNVPSLVTLSIWKAIDNVKFLGDVGETDIGLLAQILSHCTVEQLEHIENSSKGRDLTSVTNNLWKKFYEIEFGKRNTEVVVERMKKKNVLFLWRQLYKAKLKEMDNAEKESFGRISNLYKEEKNRKQTRQVQICTKVPPSGGKRSFMGGNALGGSRSNIMKKSRLDFLNSPEVKNLASLKNSKGKNQCVSVKTKSHGSSSGLGKVTKRW